MHTHTWKTDGLRSTEEDWHSCERVSHMSPVMTNGASPGAAPKCSAAVELTNLESRNAPIAAADVGRSQFNIKFFNNGGRPC